jgi:transcriptional regulator with XRE-family HTH domain
MPGPDPFTEPAEVAELYYEDRLDQADIAQRFGVDQSTVSRFMARKGIDARTERETHRTEYATFRTGPNGYERWDSSHPADGRATVYVHRLLAVAEYGILREEQVVHHRNGLRWDNRPANI